MATEYTTITLSRDPDDYLNGPTGNMVNRTSGGTTRAGAIAKVTEDDTVRTSPSTIGQTAPADSGA